MAFGQGKKSAMFLVCQEHSAYDIIILMVQTKNKKRSSKAGTKSHSHLYKERLAEADGVYFLKLVVIVLLSTLWLKLATPISWHGIPLGGFPIGAMATLVAIKLLEKDQTDRKIWFAVLVMVTILSYFVPAGIVV